jgi:hypothetical protein
MLSRFLSLLAVAAPMVASRSVNLQHAVRAEEAPLVFAHFMVSNILYHPVYIAAKTLTSS